jgi:hypothetical protein
MKALCTATGGCVIAEDAPIEKDCGSCLYSTGIVCWWDEVGSLQKPALGLAESTLASPCRESEPIEVEDGQLSERGGQDAERGDLASWVTPDEGLNCIIATPLTDDTVMAIRADDWETRYKELLKITKRILDTLDDYRTEQDGLVDTISSHAGYEMNACHLIESLIAAFEELAGEHRELQEALHQELEAEIRDIEADLDPDTVTVRPHRRHKPRRSKKFGGWYLCDECGEPHDNPPGPCHRRSKSVRTEATPTTEIPPAVSESPAQPQGQPEPFRDGVTVWYCEGCGKPTDIYPCRVCGGVPLSPESAELVRQGLEDAAEGRVTCVQPSADSGKCMQSHTGLAVCRWEVGRWKGANDGKPM